MEDPNTEQPDEDEQGQKRNYFRIDDVLRIVITPVNKDDPLEPSRILSVTEVLNKPILAEAADFQDNFTNKWLFDSIVEINDKLDFMINYFMLKEEGLLSAKKKKVNLSASGIQFTIDYSVNIDDILEIKLLLPSYPPVAVLLYGKVIRVQSSPDGTNEIALKYFNTEEAVRERVIQYAIDRQRETINKLKDLEQDQPAE